MLLEPAKPILRIEKMAIAAVLCVDKKLLPGLAEGVFY